MRKFIPAGLTKEEFILKHAERSVTADNLMRRAKNYKESFRFRKAFMVKKYGSFFSDIYLLQSPADIEQAVKTGNTLLLIDNKRLAA